METQPPSSLISDWDLPFTDQQLQAIDAACEAAAAASSSSSIKRLSAANSADDCAEQRPNTRRRFPESLFASHGRTPFEENSSPSPCTLKWLNNVNISSNQDNSVKQWYPEVIFKGKIVYSRTASEVDRASKELLKFVQDNNEKSVHTILGFDIEWKPSFTPGVLPGKVAVLQICGDTNCCHVMHIIHSGIPYSLKSLLEDPTSVKVGVFIENDAVKVYQDYKVSVKALEDLSTLANQKQLGGCPKRWSLASLTEKLICRKLPKPSHIRMGNWEVAVLSKAQLRYAATDAYVSWYLYEALKRFPDPSNKNEGSDNVAQAQQESSTDGSTICNTLSST